MRPEDLLETIGEAPEAELVRAERTGKGRNWRRWGALAAACAVVLGAGALALRFVGGNAGGGAGEGLTYMYYAGPVLPLTVRGDSGGLTAAREVTLDFAPYQTVEKKVENQVYKTYEEEVAVTDRYLLTNPTDAQREVKLLYPYVGTLRDGEQYRPAVTVDGAAVETERYAGPGASAAAKAAGGGQDTGSFGAYEAILAGEDYEDAAFAPAPDLDAVAVAVYRLEDFVAAQDGDAANPTLQISYSMDRDKTTVLGWGFNGRRYGGPRDAFSVSVQADQEPVYLLVLGEDLAEYTLQGYRDGGCDAGKELDGLTCAVTRYESTLGAMLRQFVEEYRWAPAGDEELFCDVTARLLSRYNLGAARGQDPMGGMLEDYLSQAGNDARVLYEAVTVTVPAGGTVEVEAAFRQEASRDFVGKHRDRNGYDLAAGLGSNLVFTGQRVTLEHAEYVEILEQNFGFDPAGGVTTVALEPGVEHYYLEVAKRKN